MISMAWQWASGFFVHSFGGHFSFLGPFMRLVRVDGSALCHDGGLFAGFCSRAKRDGYRY